MRRIAQQHRSTAGAPPLSALRQRKDRIQRPFPHGLQNLLIRRHRLASKSLEQIRLDRLLVGSAHPPALPTPHVRNLDHRADEMRAFVRLEVAAHQAAAAGGDQTRRRPRRWWSLRCLRGHPHGDRDAGVSGLAAGIDEQRSRGGVDAVAAEEAVAGDCFAVFERQIHTVGCLLDPHDLLPKHNIHPVRRTSPLKQCTLDLTPQHPPREIPTPLPPHPIPILTLKPHLRVPRPGVQIEHFDGPTFRALPLGREDRVDAQPVQIAQCFGREVDRAADGGGRGADFEDGDLGTRRGEGLGEGQRGAQTCYPGAEDENVRGHSRCVGRGGAKVGGQWPGPSRWRWSGHVWRRIVSLPSRGGLNRTTYRCKPCPSLCEA